MPLLQVSVHYTFVTVHPLSTIPGCNRLQTDENGQFNISEQELFSEKELSPWLVHSSGTLFHKTLHTLQIDKLLNVLLRHYFKLAYDC